MHPTIAEVLALPVVAQGMPAVRAGRPALDTPVRWVHVSELAEPAGTLSPGVFVLSVGLPLIDPTTNTTRYVDALREAGAVGLLVELGQQLTTLPDGLVQAARTAGFPLVEISRVIRFAEVIETVLGRLLHVQHDRALFAEQVGAAFRGLTVHGASASRVVTEAAELLGRPVVLEDLAHRALVVAGGDPGTELRDWAGRSRLAPTGDGAGPEGWTSRTVGPPGAPWGRIVTPARASDDAAAREATVLAHAADALSVPAPDGADRPVALIRAARSELLDDLLAATPAVLDRLAVRARALGLDTAGEHTVVRAVPAARTGLAALREAAVRSPVLASTTDDGAVTLLLPGTAPAPSGLPAATVALAGPGPFARLPELLREARDVAAARAATTAPADADPAVVHRRADLGVRDLVWRLRDDPRLLGFVEAELGPVLDLPGPERDRALAGLRAFVAAGGVVADFARRIGTGRPAAYARLTKLSELVGADLTDPEVRTSVHVALLAAPGR
ncbi:PucR family transcriptional regulator [Pseudonocardia phyllosphaerae]|uniref:PucR family transcriptional regulator n=1 Tax=Pseudonocardia phyllosphaerae TaxID=3390502 RepID=UPI00397A30E3